MKPYKLSLAVALSLSTALPLSVFANTMDVMVVTASQNETSIKDAPASISVITNEEINKLPATDITTALESVAGVHISKSTGSESKIIIRGLHNQNSSNGNYTLFLVNGRRVSSSETVIRGAGYDLSSIPLSSVEQIEVVRGPMSSLYGSEAIGGVVNVILKKPENDTYVAGSLTYSIPENNSGNTLVSDASGELKSGNVFVTGSIIPDVLLYTMSLDISDKEAWFPSNAGDNFSPQAQQDRKTLRASLTWLPTYDDEVYFDLLFADDDRKEYSYYSHLNSVFESDYDSEKLTTTLGYKRGWEWGESDLSYFYENSEVSENNFHPMVDEAEMTQNNHTVDGRLVLTELDSQVISAGGQMSYTSIENERDYTSSRSVTQNAIYVQDEISVTDDLTATLSGRITHNNQFGNDFSPRAYLVYNGIDNFTFKGGYGEGFKAPTIFQSSEDFSLVSCGGRCTLIGNPDLEAQTSKTYELSSMYYANRGYIQATLFFNDVKNLIDRDLDPFFNGSSTIIQYENVDRVETKGIELEGEIDLFDNWSLVSNATYTDAKDTEDDSDISYTPEWLANLNIHWAASKDLSFFTGVNYTGEQKDSGGENLDGYSIVSLGGSYDINSTFTVKAGITNLTDERLDKSEQDYEDTEVGRTYYIKFDFEI
ncbi:TonB-dependent receptor [Vibrio sp. 99-70-13A1]|uniref:TonB-dependent receptor domain-containing protein n=1 Tax=Vibrio sp. 99-70-13A1 TaxID=2607601 RepID=UPI001493CB35|nr:TonB-dependent receptor [Vibrio sp. 99-70-13A1]NOH95641.1 TonB-dependent receptor [Vibrio sp. 99-70-13A1]